MINENLSKIINMSSKANEIKDKLVSINSDKYEHLKHNVILLCAVLLIYRPFQNTLNQISRHKADQQYKDETPLERCG